MLVPIYKGGHIVYYASAHNFLSILVVRHWRIIDVEKFYICNEVLCEGLVGQKGTKISGGVWQVS